MSAELKVLLNVGNVDSVLKVPICWPIFRGIAEEVFSALNYIGAQQNFNVHAPTLEQLVRQYYYSGGLNRYFDACLPIVQHYGRRL